MPPSSSRKWSSSDQTKYTKPKSTICFSFSSSSNVRPLISSSMARNTSLLKQTLALIFFLLAIYAIINTFLSPTITSKLDGTFPSVSADFKMLSDPFVARENNRMLYPGRLAASVKIYMYDLPKRFTYGVIEHHYIARGGQPASDVSELKYPGHQHMAEWYLFSDLRRSDSDRFRSPVERVLNPEEADLFYVPFFSSLSLIVNPIRPATAASQDQGRGVYSDEETQEALIEWLEEQKYWKRNKGRDHVIIAQDPNALYRVIGKVKNSMLLVSDFGRLRADQASLVKDVILPYSHRINSYKGDIGVGDRKTLLFFMGNRYRKEGGKIRDLLFKILESEEDVTIKHGAQSRESRRAASQGMHTSKFCLNPAGDTPSACRLFDSIVSLCVPVIVSDSIELPFENVIDYRKIAIFVNSASATTPGFLVSKLRAVTEHRILEYQKEMKEGGNKRFDLQSRVRYACGHGKLFDQIGSSAQKVRRYFEYGEEDGAVEEIWHQISQKLPIIKLMINREKRLLLRESNEPDCSCVCSNVTEITAGL